MAGLSTQGISLTLKNRSQRIHIRKGISERSVQMTKGSPQAENQGTPLLAPTSLQQAAEETRYIPPDEADEMAVAIDVPELPLPDSEYALSGSLQIKILINESGKADHIEVLDSSFPERYVASLLNAFYQASYSPARLTGKPIRSWRNIEIIVSDDEAKNTRPTRVEP